MFDYNGKKNYVEVKRRKQLLIAEIEKQIKRIESDENHELLEIKKLFLTVFDYFSLLRSHLICFRIGLLKGFTNIAQ